MKKCMILTLGLLALLTACQEDRPEIQPRKDIVLTKSEETFVEANTEFAFRFFRQVYQSEEESNLFVSPMSASFLLSMVANGAAENTRQEIVDVLGIGTETMDALNEYNRKLITELPTLDNRTQIGIANSIWVNQDYAVLPTFADINRDMYDATVQNLDFGNAGAVDIINGWCNEHTQGMIPQIIKEVKETNLVYLLNAL